MLATSIATDRDDGSLKGGGFPDPEDPPEDPPDDPDPDSDDLEALDEEDEEEDLDEEDGLSNLPNPLTLDHTQEDDHGADPDPVSGASIRIVLDIILEGTEPRGESDTAAAAVAAAEEEEEEVESGERERARENTSPASRGYAWLCPTTPPVCVLEREFSNVRMCCRLAVAPTYDVATRRNPNIPFVNKRVNQSVMERRCVCVCVCG